MTDSVPWELPNRHIDCLCSRSWVQGNSHLEGVLKESHNWYLLVSLLFNKQLWLFWNSYWGPADATKACQRIFQALEGLGGWNTNLFSIVDCEHWASSMSAEWACRVFGLQQSVLTDYVGHPAWKQANFLTKTHTIMTWIRFIFKPLEGRTLLTPSIVDV